MSEPGSVAWLLSPPELIVACALLSIDGLPHSNHVGTDEDQPAYVRSVGLRALAIARLTIDTDDGPVVEPRLAAALTSLTGEDHNIFGSLRWHFGDRHVVVVSGAGATTMIESVAGIEVIVEPAAAALERLDRRLSEAHAIAQARLTPAEFARESSVAGSTVDGTISESTGTMSLERWQAIVGGRPVRRSDATVAARAALAAADGALWEGACVRVTDGGYEGESLTWTCDHEGVLVVDVDDRVVSEDGETMVQVSTIDDVPAALQSLWGPFRAFLATAPTHTS
jgi:hypothetical protein